MGHEIAGRVEVEGGSEVEIINKPHEVPVVLVEGLGGLSFGNGLVKLNLFQQFMNPEEARVYGQYNLVLNIPQDIFVQMADILYRVASDMKDSAPEATKAK